MIPERENECNTFKLKEAFHEACLWVVSANQLSGPFIVRIPKVVNTLPLEALYE